MSCSETATVNDVPAVEFSAGCVVTTRWVADDGNTVKEFDAGEWAEPSRALSV